MIHCAIIGAGQIGSRHLQSLAHLNGPARIELVDPDPQALIVSEKRFLEVNQQNPKPIELIQHNDLKSLTECLDVVILATHSSVRAQTLEKVVNEKSVKNLILEKVLFQKSDEYHSIHKVLQEKMIPTWVNCWMRTTDLFKQIKSTLNLNNSIQVKVEGVQWRMGTSSIHFMDLFSYFTGDIDFKFSEINLSGELTDSKRPGFIEFTGRMVGQNSRGDTLDLICQGPEDESPTIEILNGPDKYKVTRLGGEVDFESTNDLSDRIGQAVLPYQSQMTHLWIDDILSRGSCDLPTYAESTPLHLELIRVFTDHLEKVHGKEIDACPIT